MKDILDNRHLHPIFLLLILLLGAALRFYGLGDQSFWLDELHTVNEADPSIPWNTMFYYLKCCDPHPPLHFIIERLLFSVFGSNEVTARSFSALCGLVSVWTMYLLGKELMDKKLGLIAAMITSVNYFNIDYSQEARCYILAMLLSTLSFLYFIKLIKGLRRSDLLLYVLFSLLLLYTHYYSLFIVTAQGLVALIFVAGIKENRKQFFSTFAVAGILIIIGYLPWVPFLLAVSKIQSFWIGQIPADFAISFFFEYFDNYPKLNPFLAVLMLYFFWQVLKQRNWSLAKVRDTPLQLMFLVFFTAVAVTYVIPYVRSLYVVPMLFTRYTIVVLPAFILALAFAFITINSSLLRTILLAAFIFLSLHDIINRRYYYAKDNHRKTQFREMTQFISKDPNLRYPIVEARTGWHHGFYLRKYNNSAPILDGNKEATVDSILQKKSSKYNLEGFWIVGAHGFEPHLEASVRVRLDSAYNLVDEAEFFDAWAQLYMKKK